MLTRRSLLAAPLAVAGIPGRPPAVPAEVVAAARAYEASIARLVEVEAIELEVGATADHPAWCRFLEATFYPAESAMEEAGRAFGALLEAHGLAGCVVGGKLWLDVAGQVTRLEGDQPQRVWEYRPGSIAGLG